MLTADNLETLSFHIHAAYRLLDELEVAGVVLGAEYVEIVRGLHAAWALYQECHRLVTDIELTRRDLEAARAEAAAEKAAREALEQKEG